MDEVARENFASWTGQVDAPLRPLSFALDATPGTGL